MATSYDTFANLTKKYLTNCLIGSAHLTGEGTLTEHFDDLMEEVITRGEIALIEVASNKYLATPKLTQQTLLKEKVPGENGKAIEPITSYEFTLLDNSNLTYQRVEATVDTGYLGTEKDQDDTSHKADKAKEDSKETDHGTIDKTITSQEQPVFYQQLARIMPSFSLVETRMEDLTDFSHLFDNVFVPQGELRWNPQTFQLDYLTRTQLIEEQAPEKKREKPTKDPDQDLLYRYKKRIAKKPNPDETDQARLELCETLLDTFYREPY
ncbi:15545_t:CDS:2 [Entrophospora sp. SA101]|nr:15545_t:CDS:2 [Entrophospora sp. SA101]